MKKIFGTMLAVLAVCIIMLSITSCSDAEVASANLSIAADQQV